MRFVPIVASLLLVLLMTPVGSSAGWHRGKVTDKVYFNVTVDGGEPQGRIVFGLFGEQAPKTVKNFIELSTGEHGFGYQGSLFHKIIHKLYVEGGDFERGDGTGGYSIYNKQPFDDETNDIAPFVGSLGMLNHGPHTNQAQFWIQTGLDVAHMFHEHRLVFGKVLEGMMLLKRLCRLEVDIDSKPLQKIRIEKSGRLVEG